MEYADAKFKQLAVEFALKHKSYKDATELVKEAKVIEAYLNDSK